MNQRAKELLAAGVRELGVSLSSKQLTELNTLAEELKRWNRKINLTAISDDEGIAVKHLVDSLSLLQVVTGEGRLLDIGSGGGFPCIPVKVAAPELEVVSVDSVAKKISFQKQAARLLNLTGFTALHVRAEALAETYAGAFDWVVSRAFSDLSTFVSYALPVLKPEGRMVAMKGPGGPEEAAAARETLAALGVRVVSVREFPLPGAGDARSLLVLSR